MSQSGARAFDASVPPDGFARPPWGLGNRDLKLMLAILILVSGTWFFWWLADQVLSGNTHALDRRLIQALRNPADPQDPIGPRWLEEAARDITGLGGYAVLSCVTIAVALFLSLNGKHHASLLMVGATTGGLAVMHLLKAWIGRPRPDPLLHYAHGPSASFPSGHAMLSAIVYLAVGAMLARLVHRRRLKTFFLTVALVLTFLIGISRVYLGMHYPTDVLAGWAAGLVWAVLIWLITRALQHSGKVELDDLVADDRVTRS